jgi:DNA-binding LytR/AlgR family response regulator
MQNPVNYIAIDDSLLDQLMLREYAAAFAFLKELGTYSDANEGLTAIKALKPDLVFLDIEMPALTGIEVLKSVRQLVPSAVFITSHPEFALEGFELSALDYILKPLTEERFATTAKRIQEYWEMKRKAAAYEVLFEQESLVIKEGYHQIRLPVHDIIYLEAMQDYTKVVTEKKNYLTLITLTGFLEKLSPEKFRRIHRSYAVALSKITGIAGSNLLCGSFAIPVGKTYRAEVNNIRL